MQGVPFQLRDINIIRKAIKFLNEYPKYNTLCSAVSHVEQCVVDIKECRECILNYNNTPTGSQNNGTSIKLLLDNGLLTKVQALEITLDIN